MAPGSTEIQNCLCLFFTQVWTEAFMTCIFKTKVKRGEYQTGLSNLRCFQIHISYFRPKYTQEATQAGLFVSLLGCFNACLSSIISTYQLAFVE